MNDPGFRYLNLENTWPHFTRTGLIVREDGALTLARVPQAESPISGEPSIQTEIESTSITEDGEGNLYIADPVNHRILRQDACTGEMNVLPCLGGGAGQLRSPHGVLAGPRHALYIADSGNHRIQVIDLATLQLRAIWGQPDPWTEPTSSDEPGRFQQPWDLTQDSAGSLYVADPGNQNPQGVWQGGRVQKFNVDGLVDLAFATRLQQQPGAPFRLATGYLKTGEPTSERLLVLDCQPSRILVYHLDGSPDTQATARWQQSFSLRQPTGFVLTNNVLYVGDMASSQVWMFDSQGTLVGAARGYRGNIVSLGLDHQGRLLIYSGSGQPVHRLLPDLAFVEFGHFLAGPFSVSDRPTHWQRLQVIAEPLSSKAHFQLFTYTSPTATPPFILPDALTDEAVEVQPTAAGTWRTAPRNGLDLLVLNEPAQYLWIAGVLRGDGSTSPILHQMRLEFDQETWLRYLPAIYQRHESSRVFLERSLSLFESLLKDEESLIENLPLLFDPGATPDQPFQPWLDWLAGWLAFELDETWDKDKRRQALADAFDLYRQRGTIEGLRRFIHLYAGVTARITEPTRFASLWSLGEVSVLGFNTMLAPAHPQGAVVGTTATLDQSHLVYEEDYGAALFEDIAHHFCVQVYAAEVKAPDTLEKVHRVLEQEKPAHTCYHLCQIEPRMRIGFQAQLGIDSIIGGPPPELVLAGSHQLGQDTMLSDQQSPSGTIGQNARIGRRTTLT